MLIDRGDLVLVENPTFLGAMIAFNPYEPRYITVPMDADGILMDALEACLRQNRPKFIYTVPDFQNPTGVSMSIERRQQLVELASRFDVLVLEDAPYRELRRRITHGCPLSRTPMSGFWRESAHSGPS